MFVSNLTHFEDRDPVFIQLCSPLPSTLILSSIWHTGSTKWMNKRNILVHQRAIVLTYLKGLSLSLLTYWAWRVLMRKKTKAEEMRTSPTMEAMVMPITKGSDTNSSQCSPRYHQFSPTRHLEREVTKPQNGITLLKVTSNSRTYSGTENR